MVYRFSGLGLVFSCFCSSPLNRPFRCCRFVHNSPKRFNSNVERISMTLKTIQDGKEKINVNQLSVSAAESEFVADAELDLLQKELEEKQQLEQMLRGALRVIVSQIDDLECRQVSVEEQRKIVRNLEQDDLRAQMKLSMCASITKMILCLDD